jgi:hypothetical protein
MNRQNEIHFDNEGYIHFKDINDFGINFNRTHRENITIYQSAQDLIDGAP